MRRFARVLMLSGVIAGGAGQAVAGEPGWSPVIIATGDYRKQIEATPIENRPYRPLHFYGNTVRRMHYRGTPLPVPQPLAPVRRLENFRSFR